MSNTQKRIEYLQCACHDVDHIVKVQLDTYERPWDDGASSPELSISVHLNPERSFVKRVWMAFKYVFGIKSRGAYYGSYHWDDVILTPDSVNELSNIIIAYRLIYKLRAAKLKNKRKREAQERQESEGKT